MIRGLQPLWQPQLLMLLMLLMLPMIGAPCLAQPDPSSLAAGAQAREDGDLFGAVALLEQAVATAGDDPQRVRAQTQLGLALLQAGRVADADHVLRAAYERSSGAARESAALALGNAAAMAGDLPRARALYGEVAEAPAGASADTPARRAARLIAQLDLARLDRSPQRLEPLQRLYPSLAGIGALDDRARAYLSLGLAAGSRDGDAVSAEADGLAERSLQAAAELAQQAHDPRLLVECADARAQLEEARGRYAEAAQLDTDAIAQAEILPLGSVEPLLVTLEWRAARLDRRRGDEAGALAHLLRAQRHLQAIRQDLPIIDEAGRSTYDSLQRPLFTDLADLLLKNLDRLDSSERSARLNRALEAIEVTHQAEMQDYLGERCAVEAIGGDAGAPEAGVAVIYTIILEDRLEVIVRLHDRVLHHTSAIGAAALQAEIDAFRAQLTDFASSRYRATAQRLYGYLVGPFEGELASAGVGALVIVPDRYLRLIPFAALYDGHAFLAERYVLSSVTGLTMTASGARPRPHSLLAGLSEPGPVVGRLIELGYLASTDSDPDRNLMVLSAPSQRALRGTAEASGEEAALRRELLLPAVQSEIRALEPFGRGVPLLNADFTVARFEREVRSGHYSVIHIATHGHFGDRAQDSFLLAFDDVIQMNDLQSLIADNGQGSDGIELLTLSACETAKGDDRAPLGFAGAAIKARARTVVGTLWAVNDEASEQFMQAFYAGLRQHGKAYALTQAQRSLIGSERFSHPYYWAALVLFGDWN